MTFEESISKMAVDQVSKVASSVGVVGLLAAVYAVIREGKHLPKTEQQLLQALECLRNEINS